MGLDVLEQVRQDQHGGRWARKGMAQILRIGCVVEEGHLEVKSQSSRHVRRLRK